MMMLHTYLRSGIVYIPTVAKLTTGAYLDVDPVVVESVANAMGLHRAFLETNARKNPIISPPPKGKWPPPVLLKYTRVKSWSALARGASMWSIGDERGHYQIIGYRDHPDGYWVPDPDQTINLPLDSPIAAVIDRMIDVLQKAARGNIGN